MPFKALADRRYDIPKQRHRVTGWTAHNAALRASGGLTVLCGRPERGNGFRRGSMRQSVRPGIASTARLREAPRVRGTTGTAAPISVGGRSGQLRPHMGHLLSSCDGQLIRQSPAVFKRRPGLSPSPSWQFRTRTTSHPVGAHGSRTTIPLPAGRAQEGETSLMSGFSSHERNRFARLDPSGPGQGPAE